MDESEILCDKTINESFSFLNNNRSYYMELYTEKTVDDELDFFLRLHECVLTECSKRFIILDAKYYNIQLEEGKQLRGQPGVSDVTKQYLYQLAYKNFLTDHQISEGRSCFLTPTQADEIVKKGVAKMDILTALGLRDIQIRQLPAKIMFSYYLSRKTMDVSVLQL